MNDRFFLLEKVRQEQILNSGFKGFSQNTYGKTSMSMVAEEAGISKSLLFHYFVNKKEFYLYLYERALLKIKETLPDKDEIVGRELFDILKEHMEKKWKVFQENPFLFQFMSRSYYETDESLQKELNELMNQYGINPISDVLSGCQEKIPEQPEDKMVELLFYLAEGFAFANREKIQKNPQNAIQEFSELLDYIRKHFYKEK